MLVVIQRGFILTTSTQNDRKVKNICTHSAYPILTDSTEPLHSQQMCDWLLVIFYWLDTKNAILTL